MATTSPFFTTNLGYSNEVSLVNSLVKEQIALSGLDLYYLPRYLVNLDTFLHEVSKSRFELALSIPMMLRTFAGFNGIELMSKFGVRAADELTFIMHRQTWETEYAPVVKSYMESKGIFDEHMQPNKMDGHTSFRPKEGDLVYWPVEQSIFEVKYVLKDVPFFQLGHNYTFELQCEKFEYSGEVFETGIIELDELMSENNYYKLSFDLEDGINTFMLNEEVIIYKLDDIQSTLTGHINTEDFELLNSSGFLEKVSSVTGRIMYWNKPELKLIIGNLSNQDPDLADQGFDYTLNKLDEVLIIGKQSGGIYRTRKAKDYDVSGKDNTTIQREIDAIKIVDPEDLNTDFGFR